MKASEIIDFLKELLSKIGFKFSKIDSKEEPDGNIFVYIESEEGALIIGQNGETLSALNTIVRKAVEQKTKSISPKIIVDVNGYRKQAEEKIRNTAKMLGERALTFKSEVSMDPSGSFERRIVHSLFQDHPTLSTESRGFGRDRHIVIFYNENKKPSSEIAGEFKEEII